MRRYIHIFISFFVLFLCFNSAIVVHADESEAENGVYGELRDSIQNEWNRGWEELEKEDTIEMKGPLTERIIRGIANFFYMNIVGIKSGALLIGVISVVLGTIIALSAKLNKKLRKAAIGGLIITIPLVLFIFVFGITKLISIFL